MTTEQAIYQLTDLIKDRESFMVCDYDKSIYVNHKHCQYCGQALDWSDENE